jgi:hypothetical protein
MKNNQKDPCIVFDDDQRQLTVLIGTKGSIPYDEIKKVSVLNEDANFKGKTDPFSHQVLGGVSFFTFFGGPDVYVGLKIVLKDDTVRAVYISEQKTGFDSDAYKEERKIAENLKKRIDKRIIT